jgi:WD40 repeat protein
MNLKSPYRGLAAFEDSELDALYFFGRERDSEIVVANLIASRLTVLYGPSGVGKSSLLLASVARALRALPEEPLVVVFSSWTDAPERALARAIAEAADIEPGPLVDVATLAQSGPRDVYLILDQAEEYFTYHGESDGFDAALAALVDGPLRVNVLLSLREDTLAALDRLKGSIPNLFGNVLRLDHLDRAAGRAAIVKPLERWTELEGDAVTIEDELVGDVLDGVGTGRIELGPGGVRASGANGRPAGIEAPYLQLVMQRLWDVERSNGSVTLRAATLQGLGGAAQVVADHLERAIEALTPEQRDIAARLFDHLVTPSGTKIAHEASDLAQFAGSNEEQVADVVRVLSEHRILRTDEAGRWEIFHDVLAGAVLGWKTRYEAERAVLREREEARRRHRRLGLLAFGALVGLALASALAVYAFSQRSEARDQARVAKARQLVASSLAELETDPQLGIALAAEGARLDATPGAEEALRRALDESRLRAVIDTARPIVGMDVDQTSSRAIAVGDDGVARMFDLPSGRRRWALRVDGAAATFTNGGRSVLVVTDSAIRLVDAATGKTTSKPVRLALTGSLDRIVASPNGELVVALVDKPRAPVFALPSGVRVGRVKHIRGVTDAAFGPFAQFVASAGRDRVGRLWAVRSWEEVGGPLVGHVGQVLAVDLDRTGKRVATASTDQTARVWWRSNATLIFSLIGHTSQVVDVSFGPARALVTASGDGTARTWRPDGKLAHVLRGHHGTVRNAEFLPPDRVVTAGADGTIRLWDPGTSIELVPTTSPGPSAPRRRAVSPDGSVTAIADGKVIRLRSATGEKVLEGHRDSVNAVSFSPDGRRLVSAGRDHDVIVWDVARGVEAFPIEEAQSASVADARFSPDGRWLVTAGPKSARVWTADGRPAWSLFGPKDPLTAVAFEPDSRTIVTREEDGVVRRYVCDLCGGIDELTALAESRLRATGGTLTDEERARYLG